MSDILSIGTSALRATQAAIATTSNNISNVNTDGYSRQRVDQATYPANFDGTHYTGSGVNITGVDRVYNGFLANQVRTYTASQQQQQTYLDYAKQVDDMLGSSSLSLDSGMSDFFNSVQQVANDPTSIASRQVMLTQGQSLANKFNTINSQLNNLSSQIDDSINTTVKNINTISKGIADLNQQIVAQTTEGGAKPNDLLDKRDLLINQLSKYVSVNTLQQSDGSTNVFIGNGQALVVGTATNNLSTITDTSSDPARLNIGFGPSNTDVTKQISGGSLGGAITMRNEIIDTAKSQLDKLANSVVTAFNNVQNNGYDLNGNAGANFFDPTGTTAGTIKVNLTDPRGIAASSTASGVPGNNENALALANLQTDKTTVQVSAGPPPVTRSFSDQYGATVSDIATRTHQADIAQQTQQGLLDQVTSNFQSVSGVNLDEEAANLVKYQQSYRAASQIITVSNTIFDSLINSL